MLLLLLLLPMLSGALCAVLLYLAAILCVSGLRLERINRRWRLLAERQPLFLDALSDISLDPLLIPVISHG